VCILKENRSNSKQKKNSYLNDNLGDVLDPGDRGRHMVFAWSFWRGRGENYLQIISV